MHDMGEDVGVTIAFFVGAMRLLEEQHGDRLVGTDDRVERIREHLSAAERIYVSLDTRFTPKENPCQPKCE